ncbi:MAG: hypothetical protein ACI4SC_03370 [Candidatus Neoclostridium sp.]
MKHVKLSKLSMLIMFYAGLLYVALGAAAFILNAFVTAEKFSVVIIVVSCVGLFSGIVCFIGALIARIVRASGLKKSGSCRPFVCQQLLTVCALTVHVGFAVVLAVIAIAFAFIAIGGGNGQINLWEKLYLIAYYLPPVASLILGTVALGFARSECLPPQGDGLPRHPDYEKIARKNNTKFVLSVIESAIAAAVYTVIVAVALIA